ncbi:hypothetical protein BASA81_003942 [Batrachochytrium salamandrivorans]|nr:hypothetical protein BASA81_003942 [Batrachochytrium salamandrivorans]
MMEFAPLGNATGACSGLEQRDMDRPPMTPEYFNASIALFGVFAGLTVITFVAATIDRNHPRFLKVRPLYLSYLTLFASILYVSSGTIAFALRWPCGYIMFAQCAGISFSCATMVLRSLVISLEAQFAKTAADNRVLAKENESVDNDSQGKASSTMESVMGRFAQQLAALGSLFSVVFCNRKLSTFSLQEINIAKSNYALFTLLFVSPGVLIILIVLVATPPLNECSTKCHEMFLEMEIGLLAMMGYFMIFSLKIVYVMYELVGFDDKGLMTEMVLTVLGVGTCIILTTVLDMVDPGSLHYSYVMNWQMLTFVGGWLNLFITLWYQMIVVIQQRRRARNEDAKQEKSTVIKMMVQVLEGNPSLRKEFGEFGVKQYVVESIQFLEDVAQFKSLFYQKADTWRTQKVNLLIKNYIKVGTNLEINISSSARDRIMQRVKMGKIDQSSFDIFDEAYEQVREMLQNGAWREFVRYRGVTTNGFEISASNKATTTVANVRL